MERTVTARVDLQRLQILNDRLALCLDALNQVRMSAHAAQVGHGFAPSFAPGFAPVASFGHQSFAPGFAPAASFGHQSFVPGFGYNVSPIMNHSMYAGAPVLQQAGIPAWQTWQGAPAMNSFGAYGIENRSAYTNGAYAQPYAPTTQIW